MKPADDDQTGYPFLKLNLVGKAVSKNYFCDATSKHGRSAAYQLTVNR
jgi:hypothetical protein